MMILAVGVPLASLIVLPGAMEGWRSWVRVATVAPTREEMGNSHY
jgi:hypothetical protein